MNKLTDDQAVFLGDLLAAESFFLKSFGWIPIAPIVPGAPVFWKDPMGEDERSQDVAITTQKAREYLNIIKEDSKKFGNFK